MRSRDLSDREGSPWGRRPRTLVAGLVITFVCFAYAVHVTHRQDEEAVWIWMGMRSDGRCGRDFGTEHVAETKCGAGAPCCSAHGWCGASEEYCSATLGCQSGCWDPEHAREKELSVGRDSYHRDADRDSDSERDDDWEDNDDDDDDGEYDYDRDDDHNRDYGDYHGRYGGHYDEEDGGYAGSGSDGYDQYVDHDGDYDAGMYEDHNEAFDPVGPDGGDPASLHDELHDGATDDEMLYNGEERQAAQDGELTDID
ncbi:hypothetical protein T492DRAFT_505419 [Pavlovales sp. CCMP2436]|nr:hypothetical protein T492DRAFT_505419 [Pavlovales sp. CCMP2436]|mmetsp:Transcript_10047/g.26515  ORF Transcript_10047/g.26515 Transcript_10047/m.26515 type:complete len:255 (-) Transcript_10047:128-892(-)